MIDASVLVVGGGAIGGVTAAKLTGAVRRVVVLDASEEHVARLNDGLKLDELGEERTVRIEATTTPPDYEFDFILVTLKAAHHEAAKPLEFFHGTQPTRRSQFSHDRVFAALIVRRRAETPRTCRFRSARRR